ncbi:hypothetical protein AB0H29_16780 [Streptomyces thermolilacinus]
MSTQEDAAMTNRVAGGPAAVNSYDNATVAALVESKPVMLVHAFNGGYLRPADLNEDSHDKGIHLATTLDQATKDVQGHLWHITPASSFGQRPLYFIESAAGAGAIQTGSPDVGSSADEPRPQRRRITVHQEAPEIGTLRVGLPDKVGDQWRGKNESPEDTQRWIVTVTPWGGITFVPVTHPDTILAFRDNTVTDGTEARVTPNWGGDFNGTVINTFYPRLPNEQDVPYRQVFT